MAIDGQAMISVRTQYVIGDMKALLQSQPTLLWMIPYSYLHPKDMDTEIACRPTSIASCVFESETSNGIEN